MAAIPTAHDRASPLLRRFRAGALCSLARQHPWRFAKAGTGWLWRRYDCPLIRIVFFALLAAIPIGIRYGRFEDGLNAFGLFAWLAFEGWRRWRHAMR